MQKTLLTSLVFYVAISAGRPAAAQAVWIQKASFGAGAVTEARAFAIGNKGYIGAATPDLWEFDPALNAWTQKAAFIGPTRLSAAGFSIGNKGYFGTGGSYNDFYEYDAVSNTWTQKANFGGSGREGAVGCAVNGKGYIGLGGNYLNDWWEYDPVANSWTQKANLAGPGRYHAGAFAIGTKAYISCGFNGSFYNDLWEYDPSANTWTARASIPGPTLDRPVGLASGSKGYIVTGWTGSAALNNAWEWDPSGNTWTALPNFGGAPRYNACGFATGGKIYVGTGFVSGPSADIWEFGNSCNVQTSSTTTSCAGNCDGSATIDFPGPGAALSYLWSTGDTTQSVFNLCAGTYTVSVTDTSGCSTTVTILVSNPPGVSAVFTGTPPTCYGDSNGVVCASAVGGIPPYTSYAWSTGDTTGCIQPVAAGTYTVTITDSSGCSGTASYTLAPPPAINLSFLFTNASCQTCANGSASANVSGGAIPYAYNWSTGGTLVFIAGLLPGTYTCCVTDANGCTVCDSVVIGYAVSVNENSQPAGFSLLPNPFQDDFLLILDQPMSPAPQEPGIFKLFDSTGRLVETEYKITGRSIAIHVRSPGAGIFLGELRLNGRKHAFKVSRHE